METTFSNIPLSDIDENPDNQKIFSMSGIEALARNIQDNGFQGAILVFKKPDGRYEISSGHRRFRAVKSLGMDTIPCIVSEMPDDIQRSMALIDSNIHNRDMTPMDKARAMDYYQDILRQMDEKLQESGDEKPKGRMIERIAEYFDTSKNEVSRYLALLKLSSDLQILTEQPNFPFSALEEAVTLPEGKQADLFEAIHDKELTRASIKAIIKQLKSSDQSISAKEIGDIADEMAKPVKPFMKRIDNFSRAFEKFMDDTQEEDVREYISVLEELISKVKQKHNLV